MTDFEFNGTSCKDIPSLTVWLNAQNPTLELSSDRIAFLVSLVFLNQYQLDGVFAEETLIEGFIACDNALGGKTDSQRFRANQAINHLVAQRLLLRFSESLTQIEPIYRLTPLGLAISEHYLHKQKFSSISLATQLQHVAQKIAEAVQGTIQGGSLAQWHARVFVPLRYLVAEIFDRIDTTQRSLDFQQFQTKQAISSLLNEQWDRALQSCEQLLEATSTVLEELKNTLHALGDDIQSGLMTIRQSVKERKELSFIELLVGDLQKKFDQILCWGQRTIELWARYDRRVHKFLRTAIALDKDRHFSEALRHSILEFVKHPWMLNVVRCSKLTDCFVNKFEHHPGETIGALNPLSQREWANAEDNIETLFARWQLENGPISVHAEDALEKFLRCILKNIPLERRFTQANKMIQWWMQLGYAESERQGQSRRWENIFETDLFIQAHPIDKLYEAL